MKQELGHTQQMQQRISAAQGCARLNDVRKPGSKWYPSFMDITPVPAPLSEGWKD